jgi:hypothetical protein
MRTHLQSALNPSGIGPQGDIEHCQLIAYLRQYALYQGNVTLNPSNELGRLRVSQPQLVECANTISVTIKDIVEFHASGFNPFSIY